MLKRMWTYKQAEKFWGQRKIGFSHTYEQWKRGVLNDVFHTTFDRATGNFNHSKLKPWLRFKRWIVYTVIFWKGVWFQLDRFMKAKQAEKDLQEIGFYDDLKNLRPYAM